MRGRNVATGSVARALGCAVLLCAIGCGSSGGGDDADAAMNAIDAATAVDDAASPSDTGPPVDAGAVVDADVMQPDASPSRTPDREEVVSGGGRVSGGVYSVDLQLGHWFSQTPFSGGNNTGAGAAAIKP